MPINIKLFWNRNEKDFLGYYPLLLAIYKNNIEIVKLLLGIRQSTSNYFKFE